VPPPVASLVADALLAGECPAARAHVGRWADGRLLPLVGDPPPPVCAGVIAEAVERGATARLDAPDVSIVAAAIIVEGEPWGALGIHAPVPLSAGAEARAAAVAALAAAALAREASRQRLLTTADAARHALERRLHDGAQQQLVGLALELRLAESELPPAARAQVARAAERADAILEELRAVSRALHPAILSEGGLRPALRALARRSPVPVALSIEVDERFEEQVELAAYHVVAAALDGGRAPVEVRVELRDGRLQVDVVGADVPAAIGDRVHAAGGTLTTAGGGSLSVALPPRRQ
jgi:signal transduction histidine kinase